VKEIENAAHELQDRVLEKKADKHVHHKFDKAVKHLNTFLESQHKNLALGQVSAEPVAAAATMVQKNRLLHPSPEQLAKENETLKKLERKIKEVKAVIKKKKVEK
jgi:hypothetical protein